MAHSLTTAEPAITLPLNSINTGSAHLEHEDTRYCMPRELREQAQRLQSLLGTSGDVVSLGIDFTLREKKPFISSIAVAFDPKDNEIRQQAASRACAELNNILNQKRAWNIMPAGGYDLPVDIGRAETRHFNGEALGVILQHLPASRGAART